MNIPCSIFGHKWNKSKKNEQECIRKNCNAWRRKIETFLDVPISKEKWVIFDHLNN